MTTQKKSQVHSSLDSLSDAELSQYAELQRPPSRGSANSFVPTFPTAILSAVVDAEADNVLPLILAVHRQQIMSRKKWIPITGAVWKVAGSPTPKKRRTILRKLKALPEVVRVEESRTRISHYRVAKGPLFMP